MTSARLGTALVENAIPVEGLRWLEESFVDPNGRLFEQEGRLYRWIAPRSQAFWSDLFQQGLVSSLVRAGLLVDSELVGADGTSGGLVVKHRRLAVLSYCDEWSPSMLKDAALMVLDLCIRLADRNLSLQDGHPWNVLFDGPRPVFVDLTSIVLARDDIIWAAYQQFCNFFLYPLYLYSAGLDRLARALVRDYIDGVTNSDVVMALPLRWKLRHPRSALALSGTRLMTALFERLPSDFQSRILSLSRNANRGLATREVRLKFFESLRRQVGGIKLPRPDSHWAKYYGMTDQDYFLTDLSPGDWKSKQALVEGIIKDVTPGSVLDVGTNTGRYARMAADAGSRVTATDLDCAAVDLCYQDASKHGRNILPLIANVFTRSPTPGRGAAVCRPATERLRSELVMALAVMHHVVASQRLPVDRITEILYEASSRWLLIEYVPALPPRVGASSVPGLDDYTADSVNASLRRKFRSVSPHPSYPAERVLFLCEK